MELFDGDIIKIRNGRSGVVAGDVIAFTDAYDYMLLDNVIYTGDYTNLDNEEYDIMEVHRIDWDNDTREGRREYKLIWERVDPRYMLKNGDIVTLRNEKDYVVSGPCFVHRATYEVVCWDDFTDDLQHHGSNSDVDVMVIVRNGKEIWRRD